MADVTCGVGPDCISIRLLGCMQFLQTASSRLLGRFGLLWSLDVLVRHFGRGLLALIVTTTTKHAVPCGMLECLTWGGAHRERGERDREGGETDGGGGGGGGGGGRERELKFENFKDYCPFGPI